GLPDLRARSVDERGGLADDRVGVRDRRLALSEQSIPGSRYRELVETALELVQLRVGRLLVDQRDRVGEKLDALVAASSRTRVRRGRGVDHALHDLVEVRGRTSQRIGDVRRRVVRGRYPLCDAVDD